MNIGSYSYEEYIHLVKSFHGNPAPGLLIGGFIVDLALKNLPEGDFFDAICETSICLPDAVQLLTPCTIGNGWLTVFDSGRFAVTLYEKHGGKGVRVYLDTAKLEKWSEIKNWYFKLKTKKEQNHQLLMDQIKEAGHQLLSIKQVCVVPENVRRKKMGRIAICPGCNESYPVRDGDRCRCCQGDSPYIEVSSRD
jgi:formylmethanofuran dehydrogenase subunit E